MAVQTHVDAIVKAVQALDAETTPKRGKATRGSAGGAYLAFLTGPGDSELRELIEKREAAAIDEDMARLQHRKLARALVRVLKGQGYLAKPVKAEA